MHYRQYGVMVPTPYGYGKVLLYREEDQVLLCELGFGKPRARAYVPLSVPMNIERAKEDAERSVRSHQAVNPLSQVIGQSVSRSIS